MVFTEVKEINGKKYYYRVRSIRNGNKISKERIYLGVNLEKQELKNSEIKADKKLNILDYLLTEQEIKRLDKIKKEFSKESKLNFESRYEAFCALFTYNSTAIEGNTLTLQETAKLLFDNIVPSSKSLREINEILNHKKAFDYLLNYKGELDKRLILELHKLVIKETLKEELKTQIGKFRTVQVYIRGVQWLPPRSKDVPKKIKTLLTWYSKNKKKVHPLVAAAYFHAGFETVHPFVDGNGRVGRLLMNFILHKNGFPMININNSNRLKYYSALEEAQREGNLKHFINLLIHELTENKIRI
jgi:Fic family protein